jgi:hypothetical protein
MLWSCIYKFSKLCSMYEGVSRSFQTELKTKCTLTTIKTHWEITQWVMAAKPTGLTHRIVIQLHLVAESCVILQFLHQVANLETFGWTLIFVVLNMSEFAFLAWLWAYHKAFLHLLLSWAKCEWLDVIGINDNLHCFLKVLLYLYNINVAFSSCICCMFPFYSRQIMVHTET